MAPKYQSVIAGAFVDFLDKGYAYKGLKPVNWCMSDRTALAEAEVEYADHKSPSVWVRFALTSDPTLIDPELAGKKLFGLIWTTTPGHFRPIWRSRFIRSMSMSRWKLATGTFMWWPRIFWK